MTFKFNWIDNFVDSSPQGLFPHPEASALFECHCWNGGQEPTYLVCAVKIIEAAGSDTIKCRFFRLNGDLDEKLVTLNLSSWDQVWRGSPSTIGKSEDLQSSVGAGKSCALLCVNEKLIPADVKKDRWLKYPYAQDSDRLMTARVAALQAAVREMARSIPAEALAHLSAYQSLSTDYPHLL